MESGALAWLTEALEILLLPSLEELAVPQWSLYLGLNSRLIRQLCSSKGSALARTQGTSATALVRFGFCSAREETWSLMPARLLLAWSIMPATAFELVKWHDEVKLVLAICLLLAFRREYRANLTTLGLKRLKLYKTREPDSCHQESLPENSSMTTPSLSTLQAISWEAGCGHTM